MFSSELLPDTWTDFLSCSLKIGQLCSLILELASRNTAENASMSLELAPDDVEGDWLLIASAFHIRRAVASFGAAGWKKICSVAGGLPRRWICEQNWLELRE